MSIFNLITQNAPQPISMQVYLAKRIAAQEDENVEATPPQKDTPDPHDLDYICNRVCEIAELRHRYRQETRGDRELLAESILQRRMNDMR